MAEQNGIDILCDAAGSDLLLSSLFALATPQQQQQQQQQQEQQHEQSPEEDQQLMKRVRLSEDDSSPPPATPSHVCNICKRVYERADHLTRHLRSHENARPYQCSRCPKRFNRADLLTRHETTHDRDGGDKGRPLIRRSDRAAEACLHCASSKAKCDDSKPCSRCRSKNLVCQTPTKRAHQPYKTGSEAQSADSPTEDVSMASPVTANTSAIPQNSAFTPRMDGMSNANMDIADTLVAAPYLGSVLPPDPIMGGIGDDMTYFNPMQNFFPDMDFTTWNLNFDAFTIPQLEIHGPSPQSTETGASKPSSRTLARDASRGHAAFKRSPWLWEPESSDSVARGKEGLHINEESIAHSPAFERILDRPAHKLKMSPATRDRLFAIVLAQHTGDPLRFPTFPSLELLNYLLQAHFIQDEYQPDSWIHAPSFKPNDTLPELLASIIASGATFIAVPAIWKFGMAMQEVVRVGLQELFEGMNSYTRDLRCLQAFMLQLDIGIWCGFKRQTEIAESFAQPLTTMLRRAGVFSAPADSTALLPSAMDTPEVLETKWQKFVRRESYKRLVIHLFFHDVQSSVSLQKNPLISFTELCFSLPAARDLWKAPTAETWREIYLKKAPLPLDRPIPRVSALMPIASTLDELEEHVDLELCYTALLHGFWGQISAYWEAVKFYLSGGISKRNITHRLWLKSQHQELYRELSEFSTIIYTSRKSAPHLAIIAELFMMILHVSPDELQLFAGKAGEEEARRASTALEESWARSPEARYAVWHAGQVFHNARRLPPTSLKGFNAVAVYFAALALWVYGLLSCSSSSSNSAKTAALSASVARFVLIDGDESRDTRAFLQLDRGVPALTLNGDPAAAGAESLSNPGMVLTIARDIFRENFPVRSESLPPLVESLGILLRDLGSSGVAGRPSRAVSENLG